METDAEVARIVRIFKSRDVASQRAFIAASPPSRFKDAALGMINPYSRLDTVLTGVNMLAASYCEGIDCQLGITLSKAVYLLSQEAFETHRAIPHLINVERAMTNCVVGLNALGKQTVLIPLVQNAIQWLVIALEQLGSKRSLDVATWHEVNELIENGILRLLRYQTEAHIELAQFGEAEAVLNRAKQSPQANRDAERYLLEELEQRLQDIARLSVTKLPHEKPQNYSPVIRNMLCDQLRAIESMKDGAPPEDKALIEMFVNGLKPQIDKEVPDSMTRDEALEWFARQQAPKQIPPYLRGLFEPYPQLKLSQPQSTLDLLTDFISGEVAGESSDAAEGGKT